MKHAIPSGTFVRAPLPVEAAMMRDLGWTITVTKTWDKGAGTLNWGDGNNWNDNGAPAPTDTVAFFTSSGLASGDVVNLNGGASVGSLSLDTTVDFSIGGAGNLSLTRGLIVRSGTSSGTQTLASPVALSNVPCYWHIEGTGQLLVSGAVSGSGGITKSGQGVLALSAANSSFSGAMTIVDGVVNASNAAALGGTANGTTVATEAALEIQGGINIVNEGLNLSGSGPAGAGALRSVSGTNNWGGDIMLATAAAVGVDAGTLTITGKVLGSASLTKVGAGTLVLSHNNSYTQGTTVNGGILSVSTTNALGSGPITVASGATLQIASAAGTVGNIDGNGNTVVSANTTLSATRIRQHSLDIQGTSGTPNAAMTIVRSGGNPQGLDSQLSILDSLSLASNLAPIVAPPPDGFSQAIRQYYGKLDLVNNDLIITQGSRALFAEVQDMIRAGVFTNGARGLMSSEAQSGDFGGLTTLGSMYNGIDNDNNPATPDAPWLTSFDGLTLTGGEILIKYTWFGDANLDGRVDGDDGTFYTTGFFHQDPTNQAANPWLFGDFDYSGIVDANDATFYTTGFFNGGSTTHLPEPSSLALTSAGLCLVLLWRRFGKAGQLRALPKSSKAH
jgi:autotransporter-associated beta strand protein